MNSNSRFPTSSKAQPRYEVLGTVAPLVPEVSVDGVETPLQMIRELTMEKINSSMRLVDVLEAGPITVVSITTSSLTDAQSAAIAKEVRAISCRDKLPNVLLDFHRVNHLSIAFASEMKVAADLIEGRGGTIRYCSLRKEMREVLGILGLDALYVGHSVRHAVMRYTAYLEKQKEPGPAPANSGPLPFLRKTGPPWRTRQRPLAAGN